MANEITFAGLDSVYTYPFENTRQNLLSAFYETANVILPFLRRKNIAAFPSDSARFPKAPTLAAAAVNDGTDLTNTAYSPTSVTLTVGEVALMLTLTDLARTGSFSDLEMYGFEAGQAVAEKLMTDIAALGAGFSNAVGTTTANLTEAQFDSARTQLVIRKIPGPYYALLYPQQLSDLYADMGTTLNPAGGTGAAGARAETNDLSVGPVMDHGPLYQVRTLTSAQVATANAGADSAGFMAGANRAIAYVEKWAARIEQERDASLRGTEVVAGTAYAVGEIDDNAGVGIVTDR